MFLGPWEAVTLACMWAVGAVTLCFLSLQAPWAPLEECQALLGVTGWWEPLAALESVEKRASQARGGLQVSRSGGGQYPMAECPVGRCGREDGPGAKLSEEPKPGSEAEE